MNGIESVVCKRCGAPSGPDAVVVRHSPDDPLQVSECATCGAVVSVAGHRW